MLHRTKREEVEAYFNSKDLNQSSIKKIINGRLDFMGLKDTDAKQRYYEEKGHFIIGSGVDCLLSTPDDFDHMFFYKEIEKPSDTLMSLAHLVLDSYKEANMPVPHIEDEEFKTRTHRYLSDVDFYRKRAKSDWKEDSRMKTIGDMGYYRYVDAVSEAKGKQIIDISEKEIIYRVHNSLITSPVTSELFCAKNDCDIYFQKPIYFEYRGFQCKAMLDRIEINHRDKTIQYDELKTMAGPTKDFVFSMKERRYDLQIGWYYIPVAMKIKGSSTGRFKDYTILPPRFIVESTTHTGTPKIFTAHDEILHMGKYGRDAVHSSFYSSVVDGFKANYSKYLPEIWGYDRCLEEIRWYNENGWETDRDYMESGGHYLIDWNTHWPKTY